MPYSILLVEDNPTDVLLVEAALESNSVQSHFSTVDRVSEAEKVLAEEQFDVVLLDLDLPDGSGLENFTRLNAVVPRTPIIVLTGLKDELIAIEAIQRGAADYLLKGASDPSLLERAIRYAVERKRHENDRLELERARIARAEAESANRAKDQFLATLSHELRTPLNAILGWASLMRTGQLSPVESDQALETIERNARIQAQLIEDLLDVSRIVTGNLRLHLVTLRLNEVVRQAVEALLPVAAQKRVELILDVRDDPLVHGDATRLQQVVWNLVANAVKFTPPNGRVQVEVSTEPGTEGPGQAIIAVRDNGQGIEPHFLPQIFDRFRQADASPTRRHGGLGLGLAIVRNVVQMHGGRVEAASEGQGNGAVFTVWLPMVVQDENPVPNVAPPASPCSEFADGQSRPPSLQGAKILGVDDDDSSRDFMRRVFERCGAEVHLTGTVAEALASLEEPGWTPDLIICDLGMPEDDGYALLRRLRGDFPALRNTPVAALTAYAPHGEIDRAFAAGFAAFWSKPIEPEVLCAAASVLYESTQAK